jgi:hypothetical protein
MERALRVQACIARQRPTEWKTCLVDRLSVDAEDGRWVLPLVHTTFVAAKENI